MTLDQWMTTHGIRPSEVARRLGVSLKTVKRYRDTNVVPLYTDRLRLKEWAAELEVPPPEVSASKATVG